MRACSPEMDIVSSLLLDKPTLMKLDEMAEEIENNVNYDSAPLWELQAMLIPRHPHDRIKDIMTPIQCARDEIEICNINYSGDYVFFYCRKYLEETVRFFLSIMHPVLKFRYKITPMSNLIHKLESFHFISDDLSKSLTEIEKLNQRCITVEDTGITPKDALIIYICSLIIGTRLLSYADSHIRETEENCTNNLYNIDIEN